ncbi:MAG: hypothetical protein ACJ8LM_08720 [Candidatus Udaeobacter sp.]
MASPSRFGDKAFELLTLTMALAVVVLIILIGWQLWNGSSLAIKKFGSDADMVQVCANTAQKCDAVRGACVGPCGGLGTTCTPAKGGKTRNMTTHNCECASDLDCGPGAPRCNPSTLQCECASSTDCANDSGRTLVCE